MVSKKATTKNIIILGAGFGGLNVAQVLQKNLSQAALAESHKIILIDKSPYHVYTANLYETATAYAKKITPDCQRILKESVAIPITELIDNKKVTFINAEVLSINPEKREIELKTHRQKTDKLLNYEVLILALGAATNYFNIPDLKENSLPLKTIEDALKINCGLNQHFLYNYKKTPPPKVAITIMGGGATGVETAAEMRGFLNHLAKKYHYPKEKIKIKLIEAGQTLAGLGEKGTEIIKKRFKKLAIDIHLNSPIQEVTKNSITIESNHQKKVLPSNFAIWTGGVMVSPLVQRVFGTEKTRGAIEINEHLQSIKYPEIFAIGDNAYFTDPKDITKRLPLLAQIAFRQGRFLGKNILNYLNKKPLKNYHPASPIYLLPIGGRFAIMKIGNHLFKGRLLWYLRRLIDLRYSLLILPFFKALRKWLFSHKIFLKND
ncbi:NAD(P)/FAD-dependent oxidoreductase [Candidatus Peregrinibacteria bacterium]|nr:NAD(P)/FAD-dependent oxidoreductase [Candidatus Peregrinibacteria bacterium]